MAASNPDSGTKRVCWHRSWALSPPRDEPQSATAPSSTLAAATLDLTVTWLHIYVAAADGRQQCVQMPLDSQLSLAEEGVHKRLLAASAQGDGKVAPATACGHQIGFFGVNAFQAAAVEELSLSLARMGRELVVIAAPDAGASAAAAVLQFALKHGAREVHTLSSRDPWAVEADISIKTSLSAKGVALVLHDGAYLSNPHRLTMAIAAADASEEMHAALSGISSTTPTAIGEQKEERHSPSPGSGGRSRNGSGTAGPSSVHGVDCDPPLPPHLRSYAVFQLALRWAQEGGTAAGAATADGAGHGIDSIDPSSPSPVQSVLSRSPAATLLLHPSPTAIAQAEGTLRALAGRRGEDKCAGLAAPAVLLLLLACHVRLECCSESGPGSPPSSLSWASRHSLYLRMGQAPPVMQAMVAHGLWTPHTAWQASRALLWACLDALAGARTTSSAASTLTAGSESAGGRTGMGVGSGSDGSLGVGDMADLIDALVLAPPPPVPARRTSSLGEPPAVHAGDDALGYTCAALTFAAEYASRCLRWLTRREYASHVAHYKPQLCYAPGRAELAPLPWAAPPLQRPGGKGCASGARATSPAPSPVHHTPTPSPSGWFSSYSFSPVTVKEVPPPEDAETALTRALGARFKDSAGGEHAAAFVAGCTGYPLLDAALRCLRVTGFLPPLLLPLVATVWCKHMGRPWHEAARWMAALDVAGDAPLSAMAWQWSCGMVGGSGCEWACPVDAPDALVGFWPISGGCPPVESAGLGLEETSLPSLTLLGRYHPSSPLHPHSMASPRGAEYGVQPDGAGLFIRQWVCDGSGGGQGVLPTDASARLAALSVALSLPVLPSTLPDAFLFDPALTPPAIAQAVGLLLQPWGAVQARVGSGKGVGPGTYPHPFTDCGRVRESVVDAVLLTQAHAAAVKARSASPFPSLSGLTSMFGAAAYSASVAAASAMSYASPPRLAGMGSWRTGLWGTAAHGGGGPSGGASALRTSHATFCSSPATLLAGLEAQVAAHAAGCSVSGMDMLWGMHGGCALLVEDDAAVLLAQAALRKEDGWNQVVDDEDKKLKAYMADRGGTGVRVCLANVVMDHSPSAVYDSVASLTRYGSWDLTWKSVTEQGRMDACNQSCYFLADSPPPPYSYVITPRDFIMTRHCFRLPALGMGIVIFRNAVHAALPPSITYIRAETLGVIGFIVKPLDLPPPASTATRVDGTTTRLPAAVMAAAVPTPDDGHRRGMGMVPPSFPGGRTHMIMTACGDPKGSIPSYLINFVAKRTPRMWVDRLNKHCAANGEARAK